MDHTINCRTTGRNFCATPDGHKIAALFVDVDGTILRCQCYFEEAIADFGYLMSLRGFDEKDAIRVLREVDHEYSEKAGFERDVFGRCLVEAYDRLRQSSRRRFRESDVAQDRRLCENIGRAPFFREPELFPNAAPVLNRAWHNFMLFAVTIGNREAQKYKIKAAGLGQVFDEILVTSRDEKPKLVSRAIRDCNIDPARSAFIGNSQRSDGACLAVTNFIYLPLEPGWSFDNKSVLPENTGFEVVRVDDWRQAEEQGINSLVRRRRRQMNLVTGRPNAAESVAAAPCPDCGKKSQ